MDEKKISRINELYHIRSQLDHVTVVNPDGTKVDMRKGKKGKANI